MLKVDLEAKVAQTCDEQLQRALSVDQKDNLVQPTDGRK